MNLKDRIFRKSNLWHLGAILLFVTIACAYFSPALKGYSLKQGDIVRYVGMSREVQDFRTNDGEQILWTGSMFSGMPTTQISMKYEGTWLNTVITKIVRFGLPAPIFFMFVYFLSFYILALSLKIKPYLGIIGAIAFGLSSYFIVILEAGHNSKAAAIGLAPLMIAGFIMSYRFKNWILGVALSSVFMMINLGANHIQITYYMALILILLGFVELVRHVKAGNLPKFFKVTGLLTVGYIFALMVNYGNLFGTIDYAKQTIRGGTELTINPDGTANDSITTGGLDREYVTSWSYGHAETFAMVVPNFKGGESQRIGTNEANEEILDNVESNFQNNVAQSNQYWGDQPIVSGPVYIGIIVMFLAFLGLVYVQDKYKWALLSITLLTIMLSWGSNYVSALVLIPILLYTVNMFLDGKKQIIFTAINSLLLLFALTRGGIIWSSSLTDFFLDYMPGYDKFRAVTIILVVAQLCVPLMGILFLQRVIKNRQEIADNMKGFYIVTGVFALILIIFIIAPDMFNTFLSNGELAGLEGITDPQYQMQYLEFYDALELARKEIYSQDVLRSLGFFVLGAGLVFSFIRFGYSKIIFGGGLALFILLDLIFIDLRYVNNDGRGKNYDMWVENYEMEYPFAAGDGEKQILEIESQLNPAITVQIDSALNVLNAQMKEEDDVSAREKQVRRDFLTFRILNRNTNFRVYEVGSHYNSAYASYFNKSIGGYHGAKLGRYQDLIAFHIMGNNPSVLDMLNTKYYIQPVGGPNGQIGNTKFVKTNKNAMGNVWFAKNIEVVESANEEILALNSYNEAMLQQKGDAQVFVNGEEIQTAILNGTEVITMLLPNMEVPMTVTNIPFEATLDQPIALIVEGEELRWIPDSAPDSLVYKLMSLTSNGRNGWEPRKTTIMDSRFSENLSSTTYSGSGSIEMTSYHPDKMAYKSSSSETQLAVFSEMYYEGGWKAYVDNEEVPISRVNYVLRAIEVPAGDHTITMEFKLDSYAKATTMATIGSGAILLLLLAGLYLESKREGEPEELDTEIPNEFED
ncbi:MAG: hypothetical protein GQ574_26950 [Crocinitomix sp.]|nr:hypothetical protein [Crocinitomix sp.]